MAMAVDPRTERVYIRGFVYPGQNIFNGTTFDAHVLCHRVKITNALSSPQYLALGDVNADGRTDIVMSSYSDIRICRKPQYWLAVTNSFLPTVPTSRQSDRTSHRRQGHGDRRF